MLLTKLKMAVAVAAICLTLAGSGRLAAQVPELATEGVFERSKRPPLTPLRCVPGSDCVARSPDGTRKLGGVSG
jgi:hypothetical protein